MAIRRKTKPRVLVPSRDSSYGDSSSLILAVQRRLRSLDYYHGPEDGLSSPDFEASLTDLQLDQGLPMTGKIDSSTLRILQRLVSLKRSSGGTTP